MSRQFLWTILFPILCKDRDEYGGGAIRNEFCSRIARIICGV